MSIYRFVCNIIYNIIFQHHAVLITDTERLIIQSIYRARDPLRRVNELGSS